MFSALFCGLSLIAANFVPFTVASHPFPGSSYTSGADDYHMCDGCACSAPRTQVTDCQPWCQRYGFETGQCYDGNCACSRPKNCNSPVSSPSSGAAHHPFFINIFANYLYVLLMN